MVIGKGQRHRDLAILLYVVHNITGVMFGSNLCSVANIGHIYHLTIRSSCTT
jgi:hypothetical protein